MNNTPTTPKRRSAVKKAYKYLRLGLSQRFKPIFYGLFPLKENVIVFESYNGRSFACSPKALYQSMLQDERFDNFIFVWSFKEPEKYQYLLQEPRTRLVEHNSPQYEKAFLKAKYWVVNAMMPLRIGKRKDQVMLQTWHGTPLKRLRGDIVENTQASTNDLDDKVRKNRLDSQRYDYFVSPSSRVTKNFISSFALPVEEHPNMVLETGFPRNDCLVTHTDSDVSAIKNQLGIPEDKKVILYAPTWRDDQYNPELGYVYEPPIDFGKLREELGDEYVVLFRAHYFVADTYDFSLHKDFVYNVSSVDDVNDLYIVSDVLITDYSSVLFDYANLKRPMIFYMYDREHYQKELRGFYFSPNKLPGDVVTTQDEMTDRLKDLKSYAKRTKSKLTDFRKVYNEFDDGGASHRVIDAVWGPKA